MKRNEDMGIIVILLLAILVSNLILFWVIGNVIDRIEAKIDYLMELGKRGNVK